MHVQGGKRDRRENGDGKPKGEWGKLKTEFNRHGQNRIELFSF